MYVRKEKNDSAFKNDEGEKVCPSRGVSGLQMARTVLSGVFFPEDFYHLQKILQYYNFMNHGNPKFR